MIRAPSIECQTLLDFLDEGRLQSVTFSTVQYLRHLIVIFGPVFEVMKIFA